jgi:predicted membrane protein
VWGLGAAEAGLLVALRNRFPWWPVHPLGLAFQYTWGPQVYSFSIFLTWFAKLLLLRIGGIGLYRRAAPFFIGLALGYVVGVGTSAAVDFIWFPDGGHPVHTW